MYFKVPMIILISITYVLVFKDLIKKKFDEKKTYACKTIIHIFYLKCTHSSL